MSTIRVVNLQHTDATEPNIVLLADGTAVFASGITISGGTNLTVSGTAEFASGTVSAPGVTFIDDNNTGLYSPAADTVAITTAATERVRVDNAGNVGIGTTSPATALEVQSASNTSIRIDNEDDSTATLVFHNTGSTDRQISVTAGAMKFGGSSDEQMRIDSSGKVGIGENSPDQLLHLKSTGFPTIRVEDGDNSTYFDIANSDGDIILKADEGNTFANSAIRFMVDSSEHMRIDSSGRLLVGTTSATAGSQNYHTLTSKLATNTAETFGIQYPSVATYGFSVRSNGDLQINKDGTERMRIDSSGVVKLTQSGNNPRYGSLEASGDAFKLKAFSGNSGQNATMQFFTGANSPTQRMRIDSAGKVIVSSTTYTNHTSAQFLAVGNGTNSPMATFVPLTVSYTNIYFRNPNGNVGSIATSGSATSYNTSSDYRLKENVVDISDGITRVKQLSPKRFNFIVDTDTTVDGFLAHEAQTVVPEAVTGEKDGEEMQGIDQSKLVPLLTAALQEAIGEIETLKQRLSDAGIA